MLQIKKTQNKSVILLVLIILFALVLRLIFFTGIDSSDSLAYTEFAYNFANQKFTTEGGLIANRIGIFFPVYLLYQFFGVNEFSSHILMLVISLASIILVYKFGKLLFNEKAGLISAFLLSFFPLDVIHATRLNSDLPSAFFVGLSVYFFLKSEKSKKSNSSYYLFSGISLGIAYLIREMAVFIILFFAIYTIYNRKIKSSYLYIALGFVLIFAVELLYFYKSTGNPFYRYYSIGSDVTRVVGTENYGRGSLPFSLFHYPYILFTDMLLGLFYPFILIATAYCIIQKRKETYSLLFWFVPLLLYTSFGSASFTSYVPIPAIARYLFIINIPAILLLSYFLAQEDELIKNILMPSILVLLFATSIGFIYISEHRHAIDNEKAAYEYLKNKPDKNIYTDHRTIRVFNYLSGFKAENIVSFNTYHYLRLGEAMELSKVKNSYIVVNWKLIDFFTESKKGIKFPDEIYNIPENWELKKENGKGKDRIEIYYAK